MGFGRSRRHEWRRNDGRGGQSRPKLALVGAIVLAVGILVIMYGTNVRNLDTSVTGAFIVMVGTMMLLFSLSKRNQFRLAKGIERTKKAFRDSCQCCKCQNCGRNHNHWTHDDDDDRRRHY